MRTAQLVERLEELTHRFGPAARVAKRQAIQTLADLPIRSGRLLLRFHEALCFLRAYADDARLLAAAEDALAGFSTRVATLDAREVRALDETGVAGTRIYCPLSFAAARWLAGRFPESVEIDWEDAESEEALAALLPLVVGALPEEALVDVGVAYRAWLAAAKGGDPRSDLAWLLERLARGGETGRALYDRAEPRLRWELGDGVGSRTLAKLSGRPLFPQQGALLRRRSPGRWLAGPRVRVRAAPREEAEALLDAALAAVTVRYREVHAFNFADPTDLAVGDAGHGVEIAWFGVLPAHRLPLRAHYGYLLLKNGVPAGYGDASLLFDWCEIAYNVFETFRRGESAFVFIRLLAFVREWLRVRTFHLSPYQLGHGNDEAIGSGAFWFYWKLGFRPTRSDLLRLAEGERRQIARSPGYRSPREMLARLAEGPMVLGVGSPVQPAVRDFEIGHLARRAASAPARVRDVARSLGATDWRAWPRPQRVSFARLAPILAVIPDLANWPARDRRALVAIVRAKGGRPEAEYLRRMQAHRRLRKSVLRLGDRSR